MATNANEDRLLNDLLTRILNDIGQLPLPPPEVEGTLTLTPSIEQKEDTLVKLCAFKLATIIALVHTNLDQLQKNPPAAEEAIKRSQAKELFCLRLMVKCCKYKWSFVKEQFKGIQGTVASATGKIRLKEKEERIQPSALDDRIARDLYLKVMHYAEKPPIVFQTDFEGAGRECIQILSAFNYDNIIGNIIQHMLPNAPISEDEALFQIKLIDSLHLNQKRLAELISKVVKASSTQNAYKKTSVQLGIASALHKAIWNWIDNYPVEFITLCQTGTRLGGNPDVLFDVFESWSSNNMKKIRVFWPVQTMLLILCPDLLIKIVKTELKQDKKEVFLETLKKSLKGSKLADVAAISYVDICKASTFVSKADASALRYLVPAIEMELTDKLFNPKMPFKGPDGNVDENLMVDCLLSLFMLSPRKAMNSLFALCMEPSSPSLFKRVLVRTLLRIATAEGTNLPWNPTIKDVYAVHAANVRNLFNEVKDSGKELLLVRAGGKKAEKQLDEATIKYETLLNLIELFRADPVLALFSTQKGELDEVKILLTGICECCTEVGLPDLARSASQTLLTLHKPENIKRWTVSGTVKAFWNISSAVLTKLSYALIEQSDMGDEDILFLITVLEQVLTYRNQFIENRHNPQPSRKTKTQRSQASIGLEISLLINLCNGSVEIVSKCANCFGLLCAEIDAVREHIDETDNVIVANYDAYKRLASAGVHATGRQAQQKAIRTVLRFVERQTAGNYSAWTEVMSRWQLHTKALIRNEEIALEPVKENEADKEKTKRTGVRAKVKGQVKAQVKGGQLKSEESFRGGVIIPPALMMKKPSEVLQEWTNYLGFLSALGAVAIGEEIMVQETDKKGKSVAEKKMQVIDQFIAELMKLLVSDYLNVRETVKKMVGNAMSPAAYGTLFRYLELGTNKIFGDVGQIDFSEESVLYVDQVISIMKLVVDQDHKISDLTSLTNIEELVMTLVKFVRQLTISVASLQMKHKLCVLIARTLAKSSMLSFKNEYSFRTSVVENIMEWTSEFSSKESNFPPDTPPAVAKQMRQLIKELDVQVLQAISVALKNLPLQGKDDEAKSESFSKLFTFFTNLLTRCKKNPESVSNLLPEATIESLSYLVTANIEHGLEYFVTMGYHKDYDTRSAFLKVLTNILKEGTDFEMGGEELDKYYKLTELIMQDDNLELVLTLCDVTQITEADQVAGNLVRIFEANERTLDLLKAAISSEVRKTEQANTLFRLNSMATKLMVQYCKLIGVDYLRASVGPELKSLISTPITSEMDPAKLPPGQDLEVNTQNVHAACERFLNNIEESIAICPAPFREICAYLKETVGEKFPGAEHTAIAGFMFLRFMCPAIIAPDGFRVVTTKITDKDVRRSFVLVTKVLQNLANRVRFGNKEPFMNSMNTFIDENLDRIRNMFDTYATVPEDVYVVPPFAFTDEEHEEDMGRLHFYISGSKDKLAKAFLNKPSEKGTFDRLTTILAQLGAPPEPKRTTTATARLGGSSKSNVLFQEFMKRMANKNTDYLKAKNIYYQQGTTKKNVPVLYLVARNIKQDSDWEALIYFICKTTQPFFAKKYALVLDLTMVSAENQIPLQWWQQVHKMVPDQASDNLDSLYVLHANQWFRKYSKRIGKFLGKAAKMCEYFSSSKDLMAVLSDKDCGIDEGTLSVSADIQSTFSPVVQVTQPGKKTDVEVRLSKDYIQIITVKPVPVLAGNALLVNFIPIARLRELDSSKDTEVIVKYESSGVKSVTFFSKSAGQMLQQLKASKDRYNLSRPQNSVSRSTAFRPSDVPGTLLNMALLNLTSSNHTLRVAAYNLLAALCTSFSFDLQTTLLGAQDVAIARSCVHFVVKVSEDISTAEPSMTLEFLLESLHGIIKADKQSQVYVLDYIKPWLPNLAQFATVTADPESEEKKQKLKELINSLVALTIREAREILPDILSKIWRTMAQLDEAIDTILECLCERALPSSNTSPLGTKNMDCFEDIMICLATENPQRVSGKVVNLLLHALDDTSINPVGRLENHANWVRIEVLIRWVMTLAFDNLLSIHMYLPELAHIIVMTFYGGDSMLRANIHALFMNVVHSIFSSRTCCEEKLQTLRFHVAEFHSLSSRLHFGVGSTKTNFSIYQSAMDRDNKLEKKMPISLVMNVTNSLFAVLSCCTREASCVGTAYHSRWLSLTCKAAIQPNPALQPRAICALGVLCQSQELVTEDIIEKLLVMLRNRLFDYSGGVGDLELSIIHALAGLFSNLSPSSKYFKSMFWIAMSLLQIHDRALYVATLELLTSVVKALDKVGYLKGEGLTQFCMKQRVDRLKQLLDKLDVITGISFNTNFSVALTSHLMKGLRLPKGKSAANKAITTIMEHCSEKKGVDMIGYFSALFPMRFDETASLRSIVNTLSGEAAGSNILFNPQMVPDDSTAALVFTFIATVLRSSELEHEQLLAYQLLDEGVRYNSAPFAITFDSLAQKMSQVLLSSQSQDLLAIVHSISSFVFSLDNLSSRYDIAFLKKLGFAGLPDCDEFHVAKKGALTQLVCNVLDFCMEK